MAHNVLLVDDEAPEVIAKCLKPVNQDDAYEINVKTEIGDVAWELVDKATIILVDYSFPENRTGIEFLRELKKERPLLRTPIVLLSAPQDFKESEWQECLELGVKDCVCKSTPPQIIKRKVESLVEGETFRRLSEELKEKLHIQEAQSPIESLDFSALSLLVPDANEWAYTFRVIVKDGPIHRRVSNGILLAILNELLARFAARMGREIEPYPYQSIKGDLRESAPPPRTLGAHRPPGSSAPSPQHPPAAFSRTVPLGIPGLLLAEILNEDREQIVQVTGNLLTGPPHEVFMNVLLLHVCEAFHRLMADSTTNNDDNTVLDNDKIA